MEAQREEREASCDGNLISVYTEGDALFDDMVADCRAATRRIWLESYIFADDDIGRMFVDILTAAGRRGLDVRLRVDALGSLFGITRGQIRQLKKAGVRFTWSRPWRWRRPARFHRRNHRKLVIVDDRVAYVGGFNISALNSRRTIGDSRWRDTHLRMTGPIAVRAAEAFTGFHRWRSRGQPGAGRGSIRILTSPGRRNRYRLRALLRDRVVAARHRVWVTTPYFVPDSGTQRSLCEAAARGVDVRVLVPGKNDLPFVQWASRAAYSRLLAAGVRIFEYQPRVLHAKTLLVDNDWVTVGTANMDYRSFFLNHEINVAAYCPALNCILARIFEDDLREAVEVTKKPWARRPLRARIAEMIGWSARRWL